MLKHSAPCMQSVIEVKNTLNKSGSMHICKNITYTHMRKHTIQQIIDTPTAKEHQIVSNHFFENLNGMHNYHPCNYWDFANYITWIIMGYFNLNTYRTEKSGWLSVCVWKKKEVYLWKEKFSAGSPHSQKTDYERVNLREKDAWGYMNGDRRLKGKGVVEWGL
jgi:hypothetical protein